ncbi:stage V sporulation protein AB [Clostridium sp. Cult3]|uniref:stage V sporulation protein AB n=1 Tax=Clostridium sp. Cult3 TaxID=2079004 RepID=UPI001F309433
MIKSIFMVLIGVSAGITVGSAAAAFVTLLQFIPRLAQVTETNDYIKLYEYVLITGGTIFSFIYFSTFSFKLNSFFNIFVGLVIGMFLGLFASALAEVLNVIPVFAKKFKVKHELKYIIGALIFGKVAGSLLYWLVFIKH